MHDLLVYGAGGQAAVAADVIRSTAIYRIIGLIDDALPAGEERFGLSVVGGFASLRDAATNKLVIAIGDNRTRERLHSKLRDWQFPVIRHPASTIGHAARIGDGTIIMPGAVIESQAQVGKQCIINNGALVGHHSVVGDYCHISGNSVLGGGVSIGDHTLIGMGAVVAPGVRLGPDCLLTAGSAAIRDVEGDAVIVGNPGRPMHGWAR